MFRIAICFAFSISLTLFFAIDSRSQSIYAGGKGDGFSINNFAQADNILLNIYSGGINDGFAIASFAQADNVLFNIYSGGTNDGFSFNSFAQADNILFAIYSGGTQDGFAFNSFAQPDNILYAIYSGGIQDGFAFNSFAQADNPLFDIYKGGISDGFAFSRVGSIGSEIPLPIVLVSFAGKYQATTILIKWKTASEINNDYFNLERSLNGIDFSFLYRAIGAGTTNQLREYSFLDEKPFPGINYYRLKQVDFDGLATYSEIISVKADSQSDQGIILFPNPSDRTSDTRILLPSATSGDKAEVSITTATGQLISSFEAVVDDFNQIGIKQSSTTFVASGIYLVSVRLSKGIFVTKWVIR